MFVGRLVSALTGLSRGLGITSHRSTASAKVNSQVVVKMDGVSLFMDLDFFRTLNKGMLPLRVRHWQWPGHLSRQSSLPWDVIIVTDHQPLCKLLGDRTLDEIVNSRLFRIKQRTLHLKFSVSWMPGKKNLFADAASRHPVGDGVEVSSYAASVSIIMRTQGDNCEAALMAAIKSNKLNKIRVVTWERVGEATLAQFERLMSLVQYGFPDNRSDLPVELDEFWEFRESLFVFDNVILMRDRVVIPPSLRNEILQVLHAAHQVVSGMGLNAQTTVFWPGITEDIKAKRGQCRPCIRNAPSQANLPPPPQ